MSCKESRELTAEVEDRLAVSCPPETGVTSQKSSVGPIATPSPDYPLEELLPPPPIGLSISAHPDLQSDHISNTESLTCVLNGQVAQVPFKKERPERPGETQSEAGSDSTRRDSRDGDTFLEEPIEEENASSHVETDEFGFIKGSQKIPERAVDLRVLRRREKKWLAMLENWRFFMDEKFDKVRSRCRKGIPPSLRGRAWKYLCGAAYQMEVSNNKYVFDYCIRQPGDPKWIDDIQKDLNRQFPEHEMFARTGKYGEGGKEDLFDLLKAWTVLHPEEGYCQGQAPIASVLLMHMPLRDAFYCFVQICHKYLPGYYSAGLEAVQIDGDILFQLLKEKSKLSYRHLKKNHVEPVLYMIEWFMCVFCRTLPWPTVLRVWDMFFCEGVKILFKVAIVLFRFGLGSSEQIKNHPDMHAIVTRLKNLPPQIMEEEYLVKKVCELELDDVHMERMHYRAMKLRQMKSNGK